MSLAIQAGSLSKQYRSNTALSDATFEVEQGKLAVLVGPNGAGKSTTIKILTTFVKPTQGSASILGLDIRRDYPSIRNRISYLPQGYEVTRDATPIEVVRWNLVARGGCSLSEANQRARKWLETLGMWELRNRPCWKLSGGERRRVAVSMTLSSESDVVFLDEPSTGLDVEIKHVVWRAIRETVRDGTTILLTTHDMVEAETVSDKVVIISGGRTVIEEDPHRLISGLPYRFRIVVQKSHLSSTWGDYEHIDLGDRRIIYVKEREQAISMIDKMSDLTNFYSLTEVGLEDAYLYLMSKNAGADKKKRGDPFV